jgi:hypothetical protein
VTRVRAAVVSLCLAIAATGCSGDAPEVLNVSAESPDSTRSEADTTGADLQIEGDEVVGPTGSSTAPQVAYETAEQRVVSASADVVPAFFDALAANELDRAIRMASGNALVLVDAIRQNARCGVQITSMTRSVPKVATAAGKGLYETDATATLAFNTGASQDITAVYVGETKSGAFLVSDFDLGEVPLLRLLDTGRGANRSKSEVRVDTLDMCIGPNQAFATFNVLNDSNGPINPQTVFYRKTNGELLPLATGAESILTQPMRPGDQVTWEFSVEGEGLWNGSVVMIAPDLEGKPTGDVVERAWQFVAPPFFSGAF